MADEGSPTFDDVSLSISSKTKTGLDVFAFLMFCIILPGIAPMYVFL